jgi:uncharacterized membrane protein YhaH (DUF805 family)
MDFSTAVRTGFVKYVDFRGRAGRAEFWHWVLFSVVGSIVLGAVSARLSLAFSLATLLPSVAVATRRLHDTDRGGWAQLIGLVPVVGWLIVLVWLVQPPSPGSNRFG